MRNKHFIIVAAALVMPALAARGSSLQGIQHFVVIYEENHSFDNLYGEWEGVRGLHDATPANTAQVNQAGAAFRCLLVQDPNLSSPKPLPATCGDAASGIYSAFANRPFSIDSYVPPMAHTCPYGDAGGEPGGCTRDLVHRFYQEQYQLNGGRQNRYATGSDAAGLVMGYYQTRSLPIYQYLHTANHPRYAIADNFYQGAFGGSFINHHWLVAAATPIYAGAVNDGSTKDQHSVVDANGMPTRYPLYTPVGKVKDSALTVACPAPVAGMVCGDYVVNSAQPAFQPYVPGTPESRKLPPLTSATIGTRLTTAGVDWAWYGGGWSNANGDIGAPGWSNGNGPACSDPHTLAGTRFPNCANELFQFHHQPFNYYAAYATGTAARTAHLRDEAEFSALVYSSGQHCNLKPVSFIKPIGAENEHPGYASISTGSDHLVTLLQSISASACARDTMIIVTYDEYGGQWDHMAPPGQGNDNGPHDAFGPGTRVPALILAPRLRSAFVVDRMSHDTTSIIATLEHRYGLQPLSPRDAHVRDLSSVFDARAPGVISSAQPPTAKP